MMHEAAPRRKRPSAHTKEAPRRRCAESLSSCLIRGVAWGNNYDAGGNNYDAVALH